MPPRSLDALSLSVPVSDHHIVDTLYLRRAVVAEMEAGMVTTARGVVPCVSFGLAKPFRRRCRILATAS